MQRVPNKIVISGIHEVIVNDRRIPIISNHSLPEESVKKAIESQKFLKWLENVNLSEHIFESIEIRDVYMFGRSIRPVVGFIAINCKVLPISAPEGHEIRPIPGYVFIRGDAVVVLVIIVEKETGKRYMVLTDQYRLPYGDSMFEFPAGMMDEQKNFKGQAALELKEEAGIEIKPEDLIELLTYGSSLGGSDEKITIFYTEIIKTAEEIKEIESKLYGLHEHGEVIRVRIIEFDIEKLLSMNKVQPSSTLCAMFAYQNLVLKR